MNLHNCTNLHKCAICAFVQTARTTAQTQSIYKIVFVQCAVQALGGLNGF
jgi:hypothetical protein